MYKTLQLIPKTKAIIIKTLLIDQYKSEKTYITKCFIRSYLSIEISLHVFIRAIYLAIPLTNYKTTKLGNIKHKSCKDFICKYFL